MNTQILHCTFREETETALVFDIKERLTMADLETIAKNEYPVKVIIQEDNSARYAAYPLLNVSFNSDRDRLNCMGVDAIIPSDVVAVALVIAPGSVIADANGAENLDPDTIYMASLITT